MEIITIFTEETNIICYVVRKGKQTNTHLLFDQITSTTFVIDISVIITITDIADVVLRRGRPSNRTYHNRHLRSRCLRYRHNWQRLHQKPLLKLKKPFSRGRTTLAAPRQPSQASPRKRRSTSKLSASPTIQRRYVHFLTLLPPPSPSPLLRLLLVRW